MTNNAAAVSPETLDNLWVEFVEHQEVQWYKKFDRKKASLEAKLVKLTARIEALNIRYKDVCNGWARGDACAISDRLTTLESKQKWLVYDIESYTWCLSECLNERDFDQFLAKALKAEAASFKLAA